MKTTRLISGVLSMLLCIVLADAALAKAAVSYDPDQPLPQSFQNEGDAIKNGCKIVHLKGKNQKSCVVQRNLFHAFELTIYDRDFKGQFRQAGEFCIPSWYQMAKISYKDLLGNGRQFVVAEFEGNTGTATLQMILMLIYWDGGKYSPVLAETISYELGNTLLKAKYSFLNTGTLKLSVRLNYVLLQKDERSSQEFKTTWKEDLRWHKEQQSFYDAEHEEDMLESPFYVRKNIARVRLSMKDTSVEDLCYESFFDKTGIMDIIPEDKCEKGEAE